MSQKDYKTEPIYIPAGTTSIIQSVDVVFNIPFKAAVEREATKHLQENLYSYVEGRISTSEHRMLFTKWVGAAWEELSSKMEMIVCLFEKYGISVAPDESENEKIDIIGLEDYSMESDNDSDKTHCQMKRMKNTMRVKMKQRMKDTKILVRVAKVLSIEQYFLQV